MREWFKARCIWGAALSALSDEEAGRVAKAIWAYAMDGEIRDIDGAGKGILAMILLTLGQDEERNAEISEKRSIAGKSGALVSNAGKSRHLPSSDGKSQQMTASADNKNKNKNIDKESESESEFLIAVEDAVENQKEQNRVLDAAEDAGFRMSNDVRAALIALYADYGLSKVLDGLRSCSEHGAANLAYLRAVLKGKPKQAKVLVPAQDFEQRDYSDLPDQQMNDLAAEMAAFKAI